MIQTLLGRKRRKRREAAEELTARLAEKASLVVDDRLVADLGVGRRTLYRIIYDMVRRERMFMLADRYDQILLMTNAEFTRFMFRRSGKKAPPQAAGVQAGWEDSEMVLEGALGDPADLMPEDDWEIPAAALDSALAGNLSPSMYSLPENLGVGAGEGVRFREREAPRAARARKKEQPRKEARARDAFDWFTIDVAPAGREAPETAAAAVEEEGGGLPPDLPPGRQSLPERRRDPWGAHEDAARESENF